VTPKDLPTGGRVQWIDASPHRRGSAYFAVYRYLLGDFEPYLYKTDDYGKTWKRLTDGTNGIPKDWPTRVVREDPDREGLLYAGTEFGMFISFDNGTHWQTFQLNLPATPITDIRLHHKDMVVATQGRAFWILDNVTALHQLGASGASSSDVILFKPRDAYRTQYSVLGPMVDYYLPSAPSGPVMIEILDPAGTVLNTYNSETPAGGGRGRGRGGAPAGAPSESEDAEGGGGGRAVRTTPNVNRVTKNAGMNRFVWDVRHQNGVTLPPGSYQVRLKAGDRVLTQPLTVLIDPNVAADGVTVADLKEQYEHNVRTRELVTGVNQSIARVREAQAKLKGATGADAAKAKAVDDIAARLLSEPVRYGKPGLQAHITYLAGMTARSDQKVGRDAIERYQVLKKELDAINADLARVLGQ